jgi:uncharacterized protein (TIGR02001 family)
MNRSLLAIAAALTVTALPAWVHAEDAPASPFSFNAGAVTDYRYRGISQSRLKPALQAGADYAGASGIYLGTWASTIKWIKDAGTIYSVNAGKTDFEWDIYGGYKGEIAKDFSFDVGGLEYLYVGNKYGNVPGGANANTFEIYGALTFGVFTGKYSHSLTNLFGNADSKGSGYLEASAAIDLGNGFSLTPHIGHQGVKHLKIASYTDYSLTLGKDFGSGFSVSVGAFGTDADKTWYVTPKNKFTGKNAIVLGAKYTF